MLAVHNSMILKEILDIRRSGHMRKIKKKGEGTWRCSSPGREGPVPRASNLVPGRSGPVTHHGNPPVCG